MISFIKGKIINKGQGFIVVEVNNIGYKMFVNPTKYTELEIGQEIEVYTHQYVREDALDLYGFKSMEELEIFELLISISGIGPKSALGVLAIANMAEIKESIIRGDSALLTKVSGIGRKTAERIVLELREKIKQTIDGRQQIVDGGDGMIRADEIDALMALGYSMSQAREALNQVDANINDSSERIKQALKGLNK